MRVPYLLTPRQGTPAAPGRRRPLRTASPNSSSYYQRRSVSVLRGRPSCVGWSASHRLTLRFLLAGAVAAALGLVQLPALAQQEVTTGRVVDAAIGEPIAGVIVELVTASNRTVRSAATDVNGDFRLVDVPPGRYSLLLKAYGYQTRRLDGVRVRATTIDLGRIELFAQAFVLNPLVVTASRDEEKVLDAPAAVYSVDEEEIEERPATTPIDHVRALPGADIITSGLARHSVAARGFNGALGDRLYVLMDNRWASVPSLRFNSHNLISSASEDLKRIELVLGPGSALYGPNTANGVLHLITRSPLEHPGTTVSLVGGERELFQGSFRHAALLGENVGYKVSGMYFRGHEWEHRDLVEVENRNRAIAAGADPDTLLIGRRDFHAERFSGDARLDFRLGDGSTLVLSAGRAQLASSLEQVSTSTAQAVDWSYTYVQARLRRDQLFAQAYLNWTDSGDTYTLRDGAAITDRSLLWVGQIQHGLQVGRRQKLIYGVDLIRTLPRTAGSIHGRYEEEDEMTEVGGYLQSATSISPLVDLTVAARVDYHDVVDGVVFSPRAAVVLRPARGHNLRLAYNRAFQQPLATNLFLDIVSSPTLDGLPFAIRASGVPRTGFNFARNCGSETVEVGLCMRSPFTPAEIGGSSVALPLDATQFWDAAVQIVAVQDPAAGAILGQMASPDASQVGTVMRALDPATGDFNPVADVADVNPLKPEITNTIEVGYKGLLADRFLVGVDVYYSRVKDFISTLLVATPSVFFEPRSLGAHIASEGDNLGLSDEQIVALTEALAGVPVGTVTPEPAPDPDNAADILFTYRNFGEVDFWGVDVGATLLATDKLSFFGSYSFLSENSFQDVDGIADIALNATKNKASLSVHYRDERLGLAAEVRGRHVEGFPFASGVFVGDVGSYTLFDLNLTYALPFSARTEITVSGLNVLDDRHQEVPGAPFIGRTMLLRLRQSF